MSINVEIRSDIKCFNNVRFASLLTSFFCIRKLKDESNLASGGDLASEVSEVGDLSMFF